MLDLKKICEGAESIAISAHMRPDGDAFGSTLGMRAYLKNVYPGKKIDVYLLDPNPLFSYLPGYEEIINDPAEGSYDLAIILDLGDKERLGKNKSLIDNAKEVICIDHHLNYKGVAKEDHSYVVPDASSTAELVYDLLDKDDVNDDTAICIYTGIICDTGVFQYSCTSKKTMNIAGELMEYGFDHSNVVREAFFEKTYVQNQLLGRALLESILLMDRRVIVSFISQKTLKFYGADTKDLEGVVSQMNCTKGVDVAIFMYETVTGEYKVSMRSSEKINVAEVAEKFGGGGHERAAGLTLSGTFYDVVNNITAEIAKQYERDAAEDGE